MTMPKNPLEDFLAGHRFLVSEVARAAQFSDPICFDGDEFTFHLLKASRRGPFFPIDGVFIRDWNTELRRTEPGTAFGGRLYDLDGIRFVQVVAQHNYDIPHSTVSFLVVDRSNYIRLYRRAVELRRESEPPAEAPVLPEGQLDALWKNTIGYLEPANLARIREFGGRPKRGVLLTGPPGNGKTSACRWLFQECRDRGWDYRIVSPDAYRAARRDCNPQKAVQELFSVDKQGLIFFDDMDLALRDRDAAPETDDQSVFLNALDGINVKQGVAFVFTTNCPLDRIDRAFQRPGRIDVLLQFDPPDAVLRRKLIARWHPEIREGIDVSQAVKSTDGFSFAEIEEVKNLLILHFLDGNAWSWDWAMRQFEENRQEFGNRRQSMGFALSDADN